MCNPDILLRSPCAVLSIGANFDFRFEQAIADQYGCDMHVYDHTSGPPKVSDEPALNFEKMSGCPRGNTGWCYMTKTAASHVTFFKKSLGVTDGPTTVSLASAVERLLRDTGVPFIAVLKIDCEGCEYDALTTAESLATISERIQQVLVEIHFDSYSSRNPRTHEQKASRMHALWTSFHTDAGLLPFHKEPNIQWSSGDCTELSLINKKMTTLVSPTRLRVDNVSLTR